VAGRVEHPWLLLAFAAPLVGRAKAALWILVFTTAILASHLFYYVLDTWCSSASSRQPFHCCSS
jgi:peptidoglycan/LPS O-acetylase OafA/YrhL